MATYGAGWQRRRRRPQNSSDMGNEMPKSSAPSGPSNATSQGGPRRWTKRRKPYASGEPSRETNKAQKTMQPPKGSQKQVDNPPKENLLPQDPKPEAIPNVGVVYTSEPVFRHVAQVGEGTYGKVYKAVNRTTGLVVAMKRLRLESEREGFPITAAREIKLLQSLRHPNVVRLFEMVVAQRSVYMAFEYIEHDLSGLLQNPELILLPANIKSIVRQLLDGLAYLHHKAVVHRDIKGPNILVTSQGCIKLADFGLARTVALDSPESQYTNRVITLWYRPPELLLGATRYGTEVDMWGVGCLLVEMFLRRALFPGKDEISQLTTIYSIMGTPREWPERDQLPWFDLLGESVGVSQPSVFGDVFHGIDVSRHCFALAEQLLAMNPSKRMSAADALASPYFTELPRAEPLRLNGGEWHDFEAKKLRRKRRAETQGPSQDDPLPPPPPPPPLSRMKALVKDPSKLG